MSIAEIAEIGHPGQALKRTVSVDHGPIAKCEHPGGVRKESFDSDTHQGHYQQEGRKEMKKFRAAMIVAGTGAFSLGFMLPATANEAPHSSDDRASAISLDLGNVVDTEDSRGGIEVSSQDSRDNRGLSVNLDGLFNRDGSGQGITAVTTDRDGTSMVGLDVGNVVNTEDSRGGVEVSSQDSRDNRGLSVNLDGLFNRDGSGQSITAVTTDRDGTSSYGLNLGDVLGR